MYVSTDVYNITASYPRLFLILYSWVQTPESETLESPALSVAYNSWLLSSYVDTNFTVQFAATCLAFPVRRS
jgi:hypothetical protein